MRRPSILEKVYGPGFREGPIRRSVRPTSRCAIEGCTDPQYAVLTLYVDAHPPGMDWYAKLLRSLEIGADNVLGFCVGHACEIAARDEQMMTDPDLWEPGRANPPVVPSPIRLLGGSDA